MANTRKHVVAVILLALVAGFAALVGMREHGKPVANVTAKGEPGSDVDATKTSEDLLHRDSDAPATGADKGTDTSAKDASVEKAAASAPSPTLPPALDRPLRVVSLGWDLAVPGHLANLPDKNAASAIDTQGLRMELRSVAKLSAIKEALANGGAHAKGADIAILPLPEMVAAYEDLRALKPQIFFIVGWSRGRDALVAHGDVSLTSLPRKGDIAISAERGQSPTLLSLFLLDSAGVSLDRIKLRGASDSKLLFSALDRSTGTKLPRDGRIAVTSADASALIPYVAIAPEGFLDNQRAVRAWIAAWLEGVQRLERDVPEAARQVASLPGAPQTVDLVRRLGLVEFSDLHDNVRRAGLAGRDPVTIASLFSLTWRLWRSVDVLTTPAPAIAPLSFSAITSLVLEGPEPVQDTSAKVDFGTEPLLRGSTTTDLADAALLAGVFARSSVRIGAQGSKRRSEEAIEELVTRYGLTRSRFEALPPLSTRRTVTLEILGAR